MAAHDPQNGNRVPPIGRALRLVLGLVLIGVLIRAAWQVDARFLLRTALLVAGLVAAYSLIHLLGSRVYSGLRSWAAAVVASALIVAVYLAGGPGGPLFGRGRGELAAGTFLETSLLFAAARGDAGCELT